MPSLFIKKLTNLALKLRHYKNDNVIDEIKSLFISNADKLKDDEITHSIVNELVCLAEKNVTESDISKFIGLISAYCSAVILSCGFDILFIGRKGSDRLFNNITEKKYAAQYTTFFVENEIEFLAINIELTNNYRFPIIIYESWIPIYKHKQMAKLPSIELKYGNPFKMNKALSKSLGMAKIFNEKLERMDKIDKIDNLITGSSYGVYAFNEQFLKNTTNLSFYYGDFSLATSLIEHFAEKFNVKNFFIVFGYFEMSHELSMGNSIFYHAARSFCKKNGIEYKVNKRRGFTYDLFCTDNIPEIMTITSGGLKQFILDLFSAKCLPRYHEDFLLEYFDSFLNEDVLETINSYNRSKLTERVFTFDQQKINARAKWISNHYNAGRINSLFYNKKTLCDIIEKIKSSGRNLTFIITPATKHLSSAVEREDNYKIIEESLHFVSSLVDNKTVFINDFSCDSDFTEEDFFDRDHLNYNGAKKLYNKMKERGIEL